MMDSALQAILSAELADGNEVAEVSDWPPKCQLLVILRRPFHRQYVIGPEVIFVSIGDSHYWKDEYRLQGGRQVLACGFK